MVGLPPSGMLAVIVPSSVALSTYSISPEPSCGFTLAWRERPCGWGGGQQSQDAMFGRWKKVTEGEW